MSSNRNSYLGVTFPLALRENMSSLACELHDVIVGFNKDSEELNFDAMNWDALHMTFFFAGETIHSLPTQLLSAWSEGIRDIISKEISAHPANIRFKSLETFPPEKNNLIVAKFDVSPFLINIQRLVLTLTEKMEVDTFKQTALLNQDWIPHITLGKIRASKSTVAGVGSSAIQNITTKLQGGAFANWSDEYDIKGLDMCGAIPLQKWIDWPSVLTFHE